MSLHVAKDDHQLAATGIGSKVLLLQHQCKGQYCCLNKNNPPPVVESPTGRAAESHGIPSCVQVGINH